MAFRLFPLNMSALRMLSMHVHHLHAFNWGKTKLIYGSKAIPFIKMAI